MSVIKSLCYRTLYLFVSSDSVPAFSRQLIQNVSIKDNSKNLREFHSIRCQKLSILDKKYLYIGAVQEIFYIEEWQYFLLVCGGVVAMYDIVS